MKFTEESLENAVIELFDSVEIPHVHGDNIHKEVEDVLLRDDLKNYLLTRYSGDGLTQNEVSTVIRMFDLLPSSALYGSNKSIMKLITDGYLLKREDRSKKDILIQFLNFDHPGKNIFKLVNQLEIKGLEKRIPDGIVFINGMPLVVIEFKSAIKENTTIKDAYIQLTTRYRRDIPELFKYNALCVISDGVNNKMGSFFAPYDFFYAWRKIENTDEPKDGIDSLYTMVKGLFNKERLIDVIHNFIYFPDTSKSETKIVCRYPQYYAARKLFENIKTNMKPLGNGKGGTYFGATGSGKSFAMLYLTRLLMRSKDMASPTIVLITDRTDLDDQLSEQFTNAKDFIGDDTIISVESRDELKERLTGIKSGGVFLTTIQKFTENTDLLTDRANVVCISDEAHRTQVNLDQKVKVTDSGVTIKYGFAKYLHDSLPNATYVGVTGTPIDATLNVFGDITDAYTMRESVEDGITVKIVYEGRAAKVILNTEKLQEIEAYYQKCAEDGANEYQIEESKRAVTQMEVILGDPQRLKLLANDFVEHYENRVNEGATVLGKVMFVCSSRQIAYDFYKQVIEIRPDWTQKHLSPNDSILTQEERRQLKPIEKIKMVMTRHKDDAKDLYEILGTDEYRKELDRQFKHANSNFKIAIVVDMWLTGFDVPFLDAIYIDKPVQQHSLIQTISRVNRVYEGKEVGLVVDYIGIKSNMNAALAKYGKVHPDDFADIDKAIVILRDQLDLLSKLFSNFDSKPYFVGSPLEKLTCLNRAAEYAQMTDEVEKRFMKIVKTLKSSYDLACSSSEITQEERDKIYYYLAIRSIIVKLTKGDSPDASQMNEHVRKMIEEALISEGVDEIFKIDKRKSDIDIFSDEYLAKIDKIKLPNTKIKLLQKLLERAINEYKKTNRIKGIDFSKKLKKLVDLYNERKDFDVFQSEVLEDVAEQFANLFKELQSDKNSFSALGIDYEEKAFFDILKAIAQKYKFDYPDVKLIKLSQAIKSIIEDKSKYTDWSQRDDIKAELKVDLILVLAEHGYPPVPKDEVFKEIFEQAENFKKYLN